MDKSERLTVKISKEHKDLFLLSTSIKGFKSLSDFVIDSALKHSSSIIDEHLQISKIIDDKKRFINAIQQS